MVKMTFRKGDILSLTDDEYNLLLPSHEDFEVVILSMTNDEENGFCEYEIRLKNKIKNTCRNWAIEEHTRGIKK